MTPGMLWNVIDALRDGIALADGDSRLVFASRRLEEMFGYQHAELVGQPVEHLIPAHLQAAHRGHLAVYARAPKARPMGAGARLSGLRKDGTTFPAEISLSPVQTATGRFALAVVRDITPAPGPSGLADAPQARHGRELSDRIITSLYQAGLSLQTAAGLPRDTASEHIEDALRTLDDTISDIRDTIFPDRRQ